MFNISFCCCRHNVSNIFVQLTEGRSARDQPKQPPAKKRYVLVGYVLNGYVLVGYVLVGYVLNGYVWDMCGVMDMCGICVV